MTQPSIFDAPLRLPTLPHRGLTHEAAAASLSGAEQARVRRDQLRARYLELLLRRGVCGVTNHEAAAALNVGVSSLCSTRAALRAHLAPHGHRPGPTGAANTVWVLRILVHQSLTEGTCASHEELIIAALVAASTAGVLVAQQGGVVLPNGGWVPCDHPAAAGRCGGATEGPIVPADTPPPTGVACDYVSPYTDRPACVVGDYRIGHVYPFGTVNRGLVIGLSMASDGAEVVTVQWVYDLPDAPRQVWAFINDGVTPRPWEWRR